LSKHIYGNFEGESFQLERLKQCLSDVKILEEDRESVLMIDFEAACLIIDLL